MKQYLDLLQHILDEGTDKGDRTGTGTRSVFGYQMRFDLSKGFPAVTTKKLFLRSIIHELLWFLNGDTNIQYLSQNNVHIWDEWAFQPYIIANKLEEKFPIYSSEWMEEKKRFVEKVAINDEFAKKWGDLGPVYGKQWTSWTAPDGSSINQIAEAEKMIRDNPDSRRIMVSGWNVGDIYELLKGKFTAPPPCHTLFQFYVVDNKLSCQLYQRSADVFLGVPFNIASYSLLTMMLAHVTGKELGEFIHTFGDVHIYNNHMEQVKLQLSRSTKELPNMKINPKRNSIFDFEFEDFDLQNYDPHPAIKAPIAV